MLPTQKNFRTSCPETTFLCHSYREVIKIMAVTSFGHNSFWWHAYYILEKKRRFIILLLKNGATTVKHHATNVPARQRKSNKCQLLHAEKVEKRRK